MRPAASAVVLAMLAAACGTSAPVRVPEVPVVACHGGAPSPSGAAVTPMIYRGHGAAVIDVAFSPDGAALISVGDDGAARLWRPGGGEDARHAVGRYPTAVALSPNGVCAAAADSTGAITIWSTLDGSEIARLAGHDDRVYGLAWSGDGTALASGSWDGTGVVWDLTTTGPRDTIHAPGGVGDVAWSGDRVAFATAAGDVVMMDAGGRVTTVHATDAPLWSVAWSPDGATVGAGVGEYGPEFGGPYGVFLIDVDSGTVRDVRHPLTGPVWALAFAPDGRALAAAGGTYSGVAPPPEFADYRVAVVDLASEAAAIRYPTTHTDSVWAVAWSPDGRWLASASQDGTVTITAPFEQS